MPFLASIARDAKVPHVLKQFNTGTGRPLLEFHEALLRGDSPFTVQQRELMAAYVSGVNACRYCHGAHAAAAKQFGVPEKLLGRLIDDPTASGVDEKLLPVLAFQRKEGLATGELTLQTVKKLGINL